MYLHDGLAFADYRYQCENVSKFIQSTLEKAGFQINFDKSVFEPVQIIEWLGLIWNSAEFTLSSNPDRSIDDLKTSMEYVFKTQRDNLHRLQGKLFLSHLFFGNVCKIMTRFCYMKIMSRLSWDCVLKWERTENILRELNFWLSNIVVSNKKNLCGVTETRYCLF